LNPPVTVRRLVGLAVVAVLALAYVVTTREIRRLDRSERLATAPHRLRVLPPM